MATRRTSWSDDRVTALMGALLRRGLILAATVVFIGGVLYILRHAGEVPAYRVFRGEPSEFRQVGAILGSAAHLGARGIIQLGLLLLIATPVARVAFAVLGFALERDRMYTVVSLVVLAVLLFSLLGGGL